LTTGRGRGKEGGGMLEGSPCGSDARSGTSPAGSALSIHPAQLTWWEKEEGNRRRRRVGPSSNRGKVGHDALAAPQTRCWRSRFDIIVLRGSTINSGKKRKRIGGGEKGTETFLNNKGGSQRINSIAPFKLRGHHEWRGHAKKRKNEKKEEVVDKGGS